MRDKPDDNAPEAPHAEVKSSGNLAWFYGAHAHELRIYVGQALGSADAETEDLVQAAFLKFERYRATSPVRNARALLYSIARNLVQDHRRHARVVNDFARDVQHSWMLASYRNNPAYDLLGKQRLALLESALADMPERRRQMVLMNRFEHMSCEAIAKTMDVSTSTVQKQIKQGIAECREALDREPQEH